MLPFTWCFVGIRVLQQVGVVVAYASFLLWLGVARRQKPRAEGVCDRGDQDNQRVCDCIGAVMAAWRAVGAGCKHGMELIFQWHHVLEMFLLKYFSVFVKMRERVTNSSGTTSSGLPYLFGPRLAV